MTVRLPSIQSRGRPILYAICFTGALLTATNEGNAAPEIRYFTLGPAAVEQQSGSDRTVGSVGQAMTGIAGEGTYQADVGFWYLARTAAYTGIEEGAPLPAVHRLDQNRPNPFNPMTTISFALPEAAHVTLKLYDITGREVATFVDEHRSAGEHSLVVRADRLASGVYFYKIQAGGFSQSRRMVLVR